MLEAARVRIPTLYIYIYVRSAIIVGDSGLGLAVIVMCDVNCWSAIAFHWLLILVSVEVNSLRKAHLGVENLGKKV